MSPHFGFVVTCTLLCVYACVSGITTQEARTKPLVPVEHGTWVVAGDMETKSRPDEDVPLFVGIVMVVGDDGNFVGIRVASTVGSQGHASGVTGRMIRDAMFNALVSAINQPGTHFGVALDPHAEQVMNHGGRPHTVLFVDKSAEQLLKTRVKNELGVAKTAMASGEVERVAVIAMLKLIQQTRGFMAKITAERHGSTVPGHQSPTQGAAAVTQDKNVMYEGLVLVPGDKVRIHSLVKAPHLNGCIGTVWADDSHKSGRILVTVSQPDDPHSTKTVKVRPAIVLARLLPVHISPMDSFIMHACYSSDTTATQPYGFIFQLSACGTLCFRLGRCVLCV